MFVLLLLCSFFAFVFPNPAYEGAWYLQITGENEEDFEGEVLLNLTATGSVLTGTIAGAHRVRLQFNTASSGEVSLKSITGESELGGEEESADLFGDDSNSQNSILEFDLQNRTNSYLVSSGPFKGQGQYVLVLATTHTFVLTITNKEGSVINTITGRKVDPVVDGGFWSRMPSPIMMVGIMLLSQWLKPRAEPPQVPRPGATQPAADREERVRDVTDEVD